jgi:antitoxin component YwqK of YwqJK toxin-antitoxin module
MVDRRQRFKKLYPKRLKNTVWNIRSIGKLSARTNYIYEDVEVDEILSTLIFELKAVITKFGLDPPDVTSLLTTVRKRNHYTDGKKDGYWESFHDNGKLSEKGKYKKGLRVGIWESYHDNGQLWVRGEYTKDGTRDASWEYFDKNGKKF